MVQYFLINGGNMEKDIKKLINNSKKIVLVGSTLLVMSGCSIVNDATHTYARIMLENSEEFVTKAEVNQADGQNKEILSYAYYNNLISVEGNYEFLVGEKVDPVVMYYYSYVTSNGEEVSGWSEKDNLRGTTDVTRLDYYEYTGYIIYFDNENNLVVNEFTSENIEDIINNCNFYAGATLKSKEIVESNDIFTTSYQKVKK